MNENPTSSPFDGETNTHRTTMVAMFGVVIVGICALFFLAFQWFRPDTSSLIAEYFPSPTPTREPTVTPAPTRTPAPNLTATQQAWVRPARFPSLGSAEEARSAVDAGAFYYLESFSFVSPEIPDINQPGDVYVYEIQLLESIPLIWSYGWCTTTQAVLEDNFSHIRLEFILNEASIPSNSLAVTDYQRDDGSSCREYAVYVKEWTDGQHQLETRVTFTQAIHDGWDLYPGGTHIYKYFVTVEQ